MYPYDEEKLISKKVIKGQPIPKEDLLYLYMELNYPAGVVGSILGCGGDKIRKWLKTYNIVKSKEQRIASDKLMFMLKFGVDNPRKLQSVIDKTKQTCLDRYGHTCALHGPVAEEKTKKTNLAKYGTEIAAASKIVQNTKNQNNLEKYGTICTLSLPEVQEKARKSWNEKYNKDHPENLLKLTQDRQSTSLRKYGTKVPSQSEEIKNKIKKSHKNRTQEQIETSNKLREQTCLDRYNEKSVMKVPTFKNKAINTNLDKYGVPYPIQLDEYKTKRSLKNINAWGTSNISTAHLSMETLHIISSRDTLYEYIQNNNLKTVHELADSLQISYSGIQHKLHQYNLWEIMDHYTSSYEIELQQLLPGFGKNRKIIYPYEIDLYNADKKLGIEFNCTYWHSTNLKSNSYHQEKSKLASNKDIFLYHIFEYEWINPRIKPIIISQLNNLLGNNITLGARKCKIQEIPANISNEFLNNNHIQGEDKSSVRYGLFYEDQLLALMTFCKPRFNKNYKWELSRFCNKLGYNIIGGASKLFKHFINKFPNDSIISYSNIAKTRGNLYSTLGFTLGHISKPNYVWVQGDKVLSRYKCQKHNLTEYLNLGNTEDEIMIARNYMKIYDCGNKVWVYPD